ncbi:hypothetical protein [Agrobacterium tumefaciens]|uniref:hypothetical protein n=1 Tax=Agrobacterium tumefaciens TaxID=358 RepID=UPI001573E027|nr:hypothetical protein [Agrobacterium tumefaciens]WCJ63831.1 hypothetical protein G6M15_06450 [Agrobacterium tumefaciens]
MFGISITKSRVVWAAILVCSDFVGLISNAGTAISNMGSTSDRFSKSPIGVFEYHSPEGHFYRWRVENVEDATILQGMDKFNGLINPNAVPRPMTKKRDWFPVEDLPVRKAKPSLDVTSGQISSKSLSGLNSESRSAKQVVDRNGRGIVSKNRNTNESVDSASSKGTASEFK